MSVAMHPGSDRWKEITPSEFPWEREALAFIRGRLPDQEPYRVWTNFEFIADDGSVNEVDLLVLTPKGFFLVEIKSRPGQVTGDARANLQILRALGLGRIRLLSNSTRKVVGLDGYGLEIVEQVPL